MAPTCGKGYDSIPEEAKQELRVYADYLREKGKVKDMRVAARAIQMVVTAVETRCLQADGPVTPTLQEITEAEMRKLWKAAHRIVNVAS